MELNIKDRIYIPQMLPEKCNFMEYNLKRSIVKKTMLSDKDREDYGLKEDKENGSITWNAQKDKEMPLVVDFTTEEKDFLRSACEKLADSTFPDDFWQVVEKIYDADTADQ